ncbi:hypothetical protein J6590_005392 [Homalodisca vitripennis]|nr:hypothetical protein J6590_005392 [Homalodisca vitripennis]
MVQPFKRHLRNIYETFIQKETFGRRVGKQWKIKLSPAGLLISTALNLAEGLREVGPRHLDLNITKDNIRQIRVNLSRDFRPGAETLDTVAAFYKHVSGPAQPGLLISTALNLAEGLREVGPRHLDLNITKDNIRQIRVNLSRDFRPGAETLDTVAAFYKHVSGPAQRHA